MSTRVVVERTCDICELTVRENDSRVITSVTVTIDKDQYELDVCEDCFNADPFTKVMRVVKRTYKKGKGKAKAAVPEVEDPDDMHCGYPDCDYVGPRLQSLNAHRTKASHWK